MPRAVGLVTTPGCYAAGLYQRALDEADCSVVTQTPEELADLMALIDRFKAGDASAEIRIGLQLLATNLVSRGATILIAACTELPLLLDGSMFDVEFISTTDVLARKTVALALGKEGLPQ